MPYLSPQIKIVSGSYRDSVIIVLAWTEPHVEVKMGYGIVEFIECWGMVDQKSQTATSIMFCDGRLTPDHSLVKVSLDILF